MFDPLKQWRDVRRHLDAAIRSYLECLNTLGSDFRSNCRAIDVGSLEKITLEVQEDWISMNSRQKCLMEGKRILGGILNKSPSLTPISKMPREVLLEIFRLCAWKVTPRQIPYFDTRLGPDRHYGFSELLPLTHVCMNWRQIIIATPSFWEHIDLSHLNIFKRINATRCVEIPLERSAGRPLCFNVNLGYTGSSEDEDEDFDRFILSTAKFLSPHIHRLQSAYLGYYESTEDVIKFLSFWFSTTRAPTVATHTLAIWRKPGLGAPYGDETIVYDPRGYQESDSILLPIRVLRLNGFTFQWQSPAYCNLVHLHVSDLSNHSSPTVDEVIDVLAACPELQILQLTHMWISDSERVQPHSVTLSHLKVLDLSYLYAGGMALLLPLLVVPRATAFSFRLTIHPSSHASGAEALAFLARYNVDRLSIAPSNDEDAIGEYLSVARNAVILILELVRDDGNRVFSAMTQIPASSCPRFHTLYLICAWFKEKSLRDLIGRHPSITKLREIECDMEPDEGEATLVQKFQHLIPDTERMHYKKSEVEIRWYEILD